MTTKEPLEILHRLSRAIAQAVGLEGVYQILLEEIVASMGVERASIMKYHPDLEALKIVAAHGIEEDIWRQVHIPLGEGTSGKAFLHKQPQLIQTKKKKDSYKTDSYIIAPVRSFPMTVGDVPLGVINITDKKSGEPFTDFDLKLLTTLSDQVAAYMHLCDLLERLKTAEKAKFQLEMARSIQQQLLPQKLPATGRFKIASSLVAAERVGADYYDYFTAGKGATKGMTHLCIADVSGHGVGGALLASALRSSLRCEAQNGGKPGKVVTSINKILVDDLMQSEQFISLFYAQYSQKTRTLQFTNAGHNPPLLWRAKKKKAEWLATEDMLLGMKANLKYHEKKCRLEAGDVIVFYTDGLTEAKGPKDELFGTKRLLTIVEQSSKKSHQAILDDILAGVQTFTQTDSFRDDVTVVVFKAS